MKRSPLRLRTLFGTPKHFARSREVKPAVGAVLSQRSQDPVGRANVSQGLKVVFQRMTNVAERCQVVALVWQDLRQDARYACEVLERSDMEHQVSEQVTNSPQAMIGICHGERAHDAMDLVALF